MKTRFSRPAIAAVLALFFATWCLAQTTAPAAPSWISVTYVKVKPDMLQDWQDIQKN